MSGFGNVEVGIMTDTELLVMDAWQAVGRLFAERNAIDLPANAHEIKEMLNELTVLAHLAERKKAA